jgi:hypothetical protein
MLYMGALKEDDSFRSFAAPLGYQRNPRIGQKTAHSASAKKYLNLIFLLFITLPNNFIL